MVIILKEDDSLFDTYKEKKKKKLVCSIWALPQQKDREREQVLQAGEIRRVL